MTAVQKEGPTMADLDRVLVLAGGLSPEHEVSVQSGRRVAEALRRLGVEVQVTDVDSTLLDRLAEDPSQVVFPVLHGAAGRTGRSGRSWNWSGSPTWAHVPTRAA